MTTQAKDSPNTGILFWIPAIIGSLAQVGTSGDNSVLGMSTHEFIVQLGASMDQVQMANIVYSLLAGALMVFGGMLGIAKGFKRVFLAGALIACIGEVLAAVAPSMTLVVWGARTVMGTGAALMVPSILGIIVSLYQGKQRAIAFGAVGAATGLAAALMPIGAGYIMDHFGYQVAYAFLAVWFLTIFLSACLWIPAVPANPIRIDIQGTLIVCLSLLMFILGCSKISVWGLVHPLDPPFTIVGISPAPFLIVAGVALAGLALVIERRVEARHGAALVPQSFVTRPQVRSGLYVTGLIFAIFGAVFFVNVSWIMVVAGYNGTMTGLAVSAMAFPMMFTSIGVPRFFIQVSPQRIVTTSTALAVIGALLSQLALTPDGFDAPIMFIAMVAFGAGAGGLSSQSAMIVSTALNPRDAAQSSGIQCSTRNVWQAAAVAIIGSTLLFGTTANFKDAVHSADISAPTQAYVNQLPVIGFMSNQDFEDSIGQLAATPAESRLLLHAYKQARLKAAKYAFWSLILIILLHLPGFLAIPKIGWGKGPDQPKPDHDASPHGLADDRL